MMMTPDTWLTIDTRPATRHDTDAIFELPIYLVSSDASTADKRDKKAAWHVGYAIMVRASETRKAEFQHLHVAEDERREKQGFSAVGK